MSTHGSLSEVELFNLLYKSSFNKVCNFACFYVRNKQVSEDITMDAFLQLLETMKVESVDNPMALLITIVQHKSLDSLKTQVRRENKGILFCDCLYRHLSKKICSEYH